MHLVSQGPEDTRAIAAQLASRLSAAMPGHAATVVALRGELGAGKTTFVQGFAKALGITELPKSPTFNLVKRYPVPGTRYSLWHIDCYRLEGRDDLAALDMHAIFTDPYHVVLIEWPERIGDGLPRDHIEIHLTHLPAGKTDEKGERRGITISEA